MNDSISKKMIEPANADMIVSVNAEMIKSVRNYREIMLKDPYRPRYHFAIPDDNGMPGDPNGCFYADGLHHMMYLYKRGGGPFCWGHVTSRDLLHWRHHEDSLAESPDDGGCFSGGAFVDDDGVAYLSYWIFNDWESPAEKRVAGIGLAKSAPPYTKWVRNKYAVIPSTRWGVLDIANADGSVSHIGCADPSNIWKRGDRYYMLLGNLGVLNLYGRGPDSPADMRGDWAELFSSADLAGWKYEGRFYRRREDNAWTDETEDNMCPSYLPLPAAKCGGKPTDAMLLLFIAHNKGCQYYIGRDDGLRFVPAAHGRMSWKDNAFFAPEAYIDGEGRQIMYAWLLDNPDKDFETYGWSGVQSLPRSLWLNGDGRLGIAPVDELESLRYNGLNHSTGDPRVIKNGFVIKLLTPDCCELLLSCAGVGAFKGGFRIISSGESAEIYYSAADNELVMDLSRSGKSKRAIREAAPFALKENESLQMRLFVDRSVLEVFANDRQAISRRVYFTNPDDLQIQFIGEGDVEVNELTSWSIAPTNPY